MSMKIILAIIAAISVLALSWIPIIVVDSVTGHSNPIIAGVCGFAGGWLALKAAERIVA